MPLNRAPVRSSDRSDHRGRPTARRRATGRRWVGLLLALATVHCGRDADPTAICPRLYACEALDASEQVACQTNLDVWLDGAPDADRRAFVATAQACLAASTCPEFLACVDGDHSAPPADDHPGCLALARARCGCLPSEASQRSCETAAEEAAAADDAACSRAQGEAYACALETADPCASDALNLAIEACGESL